MAWPVSRRHQQVLRGPANATSTLQFVSLIRPIQLITQVVQKAYRKERSVIFREDDEGGRARVTTDEERVLRER